MRCALFLFALGVWSLCFGSAALPAEQETVPAELVLAYEADSLGAWVSGSVAQSVLCEAGYCASLHRAESASSLLQGIVSGKFHAALEFEKSLAAGVDILGETGTRFRLGLAYNEALARECPGLPDWRALFACSHLLRTSWSFPRGSIFTHGSFTEISRQFEALAPSYQPIVLASSGALIQRIEQAERLSLPLLAVLRSPHWIVEEASLRWLSLPNPAAGCGTTAYEAECDFVELAVVKIAWPGLAEKWPFVHSLLRHYALRAVDRTEMARLLYKNSANSDALIEDWMRENRRLWRFWIREASRDG